YVYEIATRSVRKVTDGATEVTTNGLAEFVAQEEMNRFEGYWWSPDSTRLAYQQTDNSAVEVLNIVDPLHPELPPTAFRYPRAGKANADVRLGIVPAVGGATRWVAWDQ